MATSYDLCIIGAGALGMELALHARRLGATVALADRGPEAGDSRQQTIIRAGYAASAGRAEAIRRAGELGLGNEPPKVSARGVAERIEQLVESRAVVTQDAVLAARGISIVAGSVRFADQRVLMVNETAIRAKHFILAVGAQPQVPAIPGLSEIDFFTPDTLHTHTRKLSHLVIIGGDADAVELAQATRRLGGAVTLVSTGAPLAGYDAEAVAIVLQALREEGVEIVDGVVSAIHARSQGTGVRVALAEGGELALDASHVLVSMGRVADLAGLDIEKVKARGNSGTVRKAGAAAGQFSASGALAHGLALVESLVLGKAAKTYSLPRVILSDPPMAEIGESDSKPAAGQSLVRANFGENDLAVAKGNARGFAKVLVARGGQILRASVVGPSAPELAAALDLARQNRLPLAALEGLALVEPSHLSLIGRLAAIQRSDQPVSVWTERRRRLRQMLPW